MGLPLLLTRPRGGANVVAPFSPLDIAGLVAWYDFSDTTTLFTDSAMTIPVTADGDPIGGVKNKANPGTFDQTQATSTKKPTYKASIFNGLSIARLDGGDKLASARIYTDDLFTVIAIVSGAAQQNNAVVSQHSGVAEVGRTIFINADSAGAPFDTHLLFFNNGSSFAVIGTTVSLDSTPHVMISMSDGAGNSDVRMDSLTKEATLSGQTWTPLNTSATLGGIVTDANFFTGDLCEIMCYNTYVSNADLAGLLTYGARWQ